MSELSPAQPLNYPAPPPAGYTANGWLAIVALWVATIAAYAPALRAPFVFDDNPGIVDNTSIRDLRALGTVLLPPGGAAGAGARPLVNLSLALNYAAGGRNPFGYHVVNLALHASCALLLLAILRRTLRTPPLVERCGRHADSLAFAASLLWSVHPLLTESVTCVIQRSEVLGALFFLLTIYGYVRAAAVDSWRWPVVAVLGCAAGMASKEYVAAAPIVAWAYDAMFLGGGFGGAWRRRGRLLLGLMATWALLAGLIVAGGQRGGTVGFGLGVSPWDYALTQCRALVLYGQLSVWPHPLVMDYGKGLVREWSEVWWQALLVGAAVVTAFALLRRRSVLGFAALTVAAILAPSSSFVPLVTQTIAEHRMYLPLAVLIPSGVIGWHRAIGRRGTPLVAAIALALVALTSVRNRVYHSTVWIWRDTVAKVPLNPRAHASLGLALADEHHLAESMAEYRAALRIDPANAEALTNLGEALTRAGRLAEALPLLESAVRINPAQAESQLNLGVALDKLGRTDDAVALYQRALKLQPTLAAAHDALGAVWLRRNDPSGARDELEFARRLDPDRGATYYNLAAATAQAGRLAEARAYFDRAVQLEPDDAAGRVTWANTLLGAGQTAEAIATYEAALRVRPDFTDAHYNLGNALAAGGRYAEAADHYRAALAADPQLATAENNLGNALTMLGRDAEAVPHYERALALKPQNASAHNNLGLALARLGRLRDAAAHFAAALEVNPNFAEARQNLAQARAQLGETSP